MDPQLSETAERLDAVSSSLCLAKWSQATIHLHNGHTQSCHHVRAHSIPLQGLENRPSQLHNTAFKLKTRQQMLQGQRPRECQYCWNVEAAGQTSDRVYKSAEPWAQDFFDANVRAAPDPTPRYLEVAFDNICNFKCMYCSPIQSSSWANEIKEFGGYPTSTRYNSPWIRKFQGTEKLSPPNHQKYIDAFWQWWPELHRSLLDLRITGGEPLLTASTWRLLDELAADSAPQMAVSLNSNLGAPDHLIQRLIRSIAALKGRVRSFTLFCSVDSVGAQAEYIRFGLNFDRFMKNATTILEQTPSQSFQMSYMITVNALSLPGLEELLRQIAQLKSKFPQHKIWIDTPYLRNPEHQSVFILPATFDEYLIRAIQTIKELGFSETEVERFERILTVMRTHRFQGLKAWRLRRDFRRMFDEHDRRRGTNFQATFPEYKEFYQSCP